MPVLEQMLDFLILTCFFMMFSTIKDCKNDNDSYFINLYKKKVSSKHSSILWKLSFNILKHIHKPIFLILFIMGTFDIKKLDSLKSLGYICLFAVFLPFEHLYRLCPMLTGIFISLFIITEYYFEMHYTIIKRDENVFHWS